MRKRPFAMIVCVSAAFWLCSSDVRAQDAEAEQKAQELVAAAEAAQAQAAARKTALEADQARLVAAREALAKLQADMVAAEKRQKELAELLPKQEQGAAAAAEVKTKADQAAEKPKALLQIAQKALAAFKQVLAESQEAAETARLSAEEAQKQAANAKGAPEEKDLAVQAELASAVLAAANAAVQKATEAVTAAESREKAAAGLAQKALEEAAKAAADLQKAQTELKQTQGQLEAARELLAKLPEQIAQAEAQLAPLTSAYEAAQTAYRTAAEEALEKQRAAETALIALGKLVSFSQSVAPIFAKRCLACHNARVAKGRFNMETFAGIMKGGESGEVVEAGNGELSTLYIMVEDGSMPQDADPLTPDQLALIKKWIDTGAKLDAGLSPTDPLIKIMPKFPQPSAPEQYRVPVPVTAVAFSRDGGLVATSGYHEVVLWNATDGQLVRRIGNIAERVYDLAFSPDGQTLAVASGTPAEIGEVKLFKVEDGTLLADWVATDDAVFSAAFSPDGTRLAAAGADRAIRVINVASGQEELLIEDHADWVMGVAWSPDGTKLASASRDKTAKVFDAKTGESLVTFNAHGQPVFDVAFSPDGNQVVTSGSDRNLRVWNTGDANQVRAIGGFGNEVFRIQVTADGLVFSCSADKTARLHRLADGAAVRTYSGHAEWVYSLAYHPETRRLATGGFDGEVRVWNSEDGAVLASFIAAPGYQPGAAAAKN